MSKKLLHTDNLITSRMEAETKTKLITTIRMQFGESISRDFLQKHGLKISVQAMHDNFIALLTTKLFAQEKQSDTHEEPKKISHEYLSPGIWNNIKNRLYLLSRKKVKFLAPKISTFNFEYIEKTTNINYCGYSFPTEK